ncbi:Hypothetical predicted protein, partial [Mytilus galloprovincialis]
MSTELQKSFQNGYNKNVFRKDRNKNGVGIFIAVHDKCTTVAVNNSEKYCELQWSEIQQRQNPSLWLRLPSTKCKYTHCLTSKHQYYMSATSKDKPIILTGNFNFPPIDWDNNTVKSGKAQ